MNSRVRLAQVSGMVLSQIQPYVGCLLIYWMLKYCFSLLVIQQVTVEPTCINVFTYASLCKLASVIKLDQPRDQQAPDYRLGWLVPLGLGVSVQCSDLNVKMCLCFLPVPLKHNSLSFFMTCLEVVRFVTLGIKPYFSLLSVEGMRKGEGKLGFRKWSYLRAHSWTFKQLVTWTFKQQVLSTCFGTLMNAGLRMNSVS